MRSMSVTMGVPRKARFVRLRACDMVSEIAGDSGAGADGVFRARRGYARKRSPLGVSATPSSIRFAAGPTRQRDPSPQARRTEPAPGPTSRVPHTRRPQRHVRVREPDDERPGRRCPTRRHPAGRHPASGRPDGERCGAALSRGRTRDALSRPQRTLFDLTGSKPTTPTRELVHRAGQIVAWTPAGAHRRRSRHSQRTSRDMTNRSDIPLSARARCVVATGATSLVGMSRCRHE
jgi:hypothetical protein